MSEPVPEAPPAAAVPEEKGPRPIDPAKRDAAAKKQAVRRAVDKLKAAKTVEELEELMRERLHTEAPKPAPVTPAPAPIVVVDPVKERELLEAAILEKLQAANAQFLKGTRFEIDDVQAQILTRSASPIALMYGAKLDNPWVGLAVALALVWGRPTWDVAVHGADPFSKEPASKEPKLRAVASPLPAEGRQA